MAYTTAALQEEMDQKDSKQICLLNAFKPSKRLSKVVLTNNCRGWAEGELSGLYRVSLDISLMKKDANAIPDWAPWLASWVRLPVAVLLWKIRKVFGSRKTKTFDRCASQMVLYVWVVDNVRAIDKSTLRQYGRIRYGRAE